MRIVKPVFLRSWEQLRSKSHGPIFSIESVCQAAEQRLRRLTKPDNHVPVLDAALDLTSTNSDLLLENMLLRRQLIALKRQAKRPALTWRGRTLFVLLASGLGIWKQALVILQPETVLSWHRDLLYHGRRKRLDCAYQRVGCRPAR